MSNAEDSNLFSNFPKISLRPRLGEVSINEAYSMHKYSEVEFKNMLEFLIDNICVVVGGQVFQQSVGIPMGTNCAPLLADLFLYSYEAEFIQKLLHEKKKSLAVAFNSIFLYIDDVLSIKNN
jgi:hypothetical protein